MRMTKRDKAIMAALATRSVVSEEALAEQLGVTVNSLRILIFRLRKKIAPREIFTNYGKGYSLKKQDA